MVLLAALAVAAEPAPPERRARATVRIVSAVRASSREWHHLPPERRREILIRDERGRPLRLRLIELE